MSESSTKLNRRDFLKGAALVGAGALGAGALAACSPEEASDAPPSGSVAAGGTSDPTTRAAASDQADGKLTWLPKEPTINDADVEAEVSADIIVIGCGVAGTCAVRAAAEDGASVIAFEKGDGPQSRSGEFAVVNGNVMARWGRDNFDPEELVEHEMDEMSYFPKRSILSKWAYNAAEVFDWFIAAKEDLYICKDSFDDLPDGTECYLYPWYYPLPNNYDYKKERHPTYPSSCAFGPNGQQPVVQANMDKAIAEGDVAPYWGHFVEKLIMDGKRVSGCYARNAATGKYVKATATKGIVLAAGDYANNPDMVDYYLPEVRQNGVPSLWRNADVEGNWTNTGDGHKLGAWINAAIQQHHAPMIHWTGIQPMGTDAFLRLNLYGKRFMNEDVPGQQIENQVESQPGKKIWEIWDSAWPEQIGYFQPQHQCVIYVGDPPKGWSGTGLVQADVCENAAEQGRILKADTLEALLDLIEDIPDKATALASIKRYNELAKKGKDEDFGKNATRMFALENPPFYAGTAGVSAMLICGGGLISDEECRVYDNNDEVIPGIYVAGNIQGCRYAVQYPIAFKGISHSLCMYYGYVAGKNAIKGI
jgi:succinate dehydrogenase/fumarate reductase flavoprotein subunit